MIGDHASKNGKERKDYAIAIGAYAQAGENGIAIGADVVANDNEIRIGKEIHESVVIAGKKINFNSDGTVTWENG